MRTMYLDPNTWDLTLDSSRNIAVADAPYALAQDAASAMRAWLGECYYDTSQGVPYRQILGQFPPIQLLKASLIAAAMTVPGVTSAQCFLSAIDRKTRQITGQVQVTATNPVTGLSVTTAANFTSDFSRDFS